MELETLQIKRVTGNWDKHKTYIPVSGELILIALKDSTGLSAGPTAFSTVDKYILKFGTENNPITVSGTDEGLTLQQLVEKNNFYVDCGSVTSMITESIMNQLGDTEPLPFISQDSSHGSSYRIARADHTHGLGKVTVESILGVNNDTSDAHCRKISAGTSTPSPSQGSIGDIYIKYDAQ